jgi:uncharacterized protein with GYD domain
MAHYIILTQFNEGALDEPQQLKNLGDEVSARIKEECPDLEWKESYVTTGSYDVVDLVKSDDPQQVMRAALIIRTLGHAHTETMQASEWKDFLDAL